MKDYEKKLKEQLKYTTYYKEEPEKKPRIEFDIDTSRYRMHGPRIVKRIKIDL